MQHSTETTETGVSEQLGDSLSARLKAATADLHHKVEHGSEVNRRIVMKIRGDGSDAEAQRAAYRNAYIAFLVAAYGFEHAALTAVREFALVATPDMQGYPAEHVDASALIRDDIEKLTGESNSLAAPDDFPKISSIAQLAGVEYVRRGSRNGNAYIAHAVRGNLGLGPDDGAAFLNLDNGQTKPNWERFKNWLDALELSEQDQNIAIAAAMETFRAIGRWHQIVAKDIAS